MLLDRYEPYFFNSNFKEAASKAGWVAYRGELVLVESFAVSMSGAAAIFVPRCGSGWLVSNVVITTSR